MRFSTHRCARTIDPQALCLNEAIGSTPHRQTQTLDRAVFPDCFGGNADMGKHLACPLPQRNDLFVLLVGLLPVHHLGNGDRTSGHVGHPQPCPSGAKGPGSRSFQTDTGLKSAIGSPCQREPPKRIRFRNSRIAINSRSSADRRRNVYDSESFSQLG